MSELHSRAKSLIHAAQQRQKFYADKKRAPARFSLGDLVLLSTKNLKLKDECGKKLLPKYLGPLKVVGLIGDAAYRLELPQHLKVHPVFHVSLLHRYNQGSSAPTPPPWHLIADTSQPEVVHVLKHRERTSGNLSLREYLVRWEDHPNSDDSWVPCTRVPEGPVLRYWAARTPTESEGLESPLLAAHRRSRRLLGIAAAHPEQSHVSGRPVWARDPLSMVCRLGLVIPHSRVRDGREPARKGRFKRPQWPTVCSIAALFLEAA
jgi:hypothetical protein